MILARACKYENCVTIHVTEGELQNMNFTLLQFSLYRGAQKECNTYDHFFQQNNTKINDFEGVLILESFSEAMSFSKCAPFVSKVTFEAGRNFFE